MWKPEDICEALKCAQPSAAAAALCVSIDSRTIRPGDLFVCIRGENNDGHKYLQEIRAKGASGAVVERSWLEGDLSRELQGFPLYPADDGIQALQEMAVHRRKKMSGKVIAITGSSGKTSAKEMMSQTARTLLPAGKVFATEGNLNNHIGMPLSLCRAGESDDLIILEMGMNHAGEISLLSRIARPHISLITSISGAHMEFFSSVDEIARAKLEILDGMDKGILFFPSGYPGESLARTLCEEKSVEMSIFGIQGREKEFSAAKNYSADSSGIEFTWKGYTIKNSYYFSYVMAHNLYGCLEALQGCGFDPREISRAAAQARPRTGRRFQVYRKKSNPSQILIDDSYNANPDSFEQALRSLREILPSGRLALFAGEMAELGKNSEEPAHENAGKLAGELRYEYLAVAGNKNAEILKKAYNRAMPAGIAELFDSSRSAAEKAELLDEYDGILVKGSRSARMDIVADRIREKGYV